ncbi:hypothetical protein ASF71_20645 [Deinococcus sp. Leaf326]|nr:hypothetical protein [Deinococcus sp. Leaf326]KQR11255.1 hypothetical protein ASF71_20645 [Deinococcus sp. Leaf326]
MRRAQGQHQCEAHEGETDRQQGWGELRLDFLLQNSVFLVLATAFVEPFGESALLDMGIDQRSVDLLENLGLPGEGCS